MSDVNQDTAHLTYSSCRKVWRVVNRIVAADNVDVRHVGVVEVTDIAVNSIMRPYRVGRKAWHVALVRVARLMTQGMVVAASHHSGVLAVGVARRTRTALMAGACVARAGSARRANFAHAGNAYGGARCDFPVLDSQGSAGGNPVTSRKSHADDPGHILSKVDEKGASHIVGVDLHDPFGLVFPNESQRRGNCLLERTQRDRGAAVGRHDLKPGRCGGHRCNFSRRSPVAGAPFPIKRDPSIVRLAVEKMIVSYRTRARLPGLGIGRVSKHGRGSVTRLGLCGKREDQRTAPIRSGNRLVAPQIFMCMERGAQSAKLLQEKHKSMHKHKGDAHRRSQICSCRGGRRHCWWFPR